MMTPNAIDVTGTVTSDSERFDSPANISPTD